jgi:phosphoenolpyruvate---glycerone phosphotransferase subunit DhaL
VVTSADVIACLRAFHDVVEGEQARLDALDAVVGDGDHGGTMVMGMRNVVAALPGGEVESQAAVLRMAARRFAFVGGSSGPLWGTGLLRAAQSLDGEPDPDLAAWARAATEAAAGIAARGNCAEGDCTLLDVMAPAARALSEAAAAGHTAREAVQRAQAAGAAGLERTRELTPRRGRARRVADLAHGHADPGAASALLVWETVAAAVSA